MFRVHSFYCPFYRHFRKSLSHPSLPRWHTKVAVAAFTGLRADFIQVLEEQCLALKSENTFNRKQYRERGTIQQL